MNDKISKILSVVTGLIGLIGVYFLVRIIMEGDEVVKQNVDVQNSLVSPYITFAIWILAITAILAIVFSIWNLIKHPQLLKQTLISLVALGALLALSYALADDSAVTNVSGNVLKDGEAGPISKWVSTGIWYTMILGGIALLGILADFVKSLVSK
jgi:glucan phosphoethanolaminetransferase (alkaline phosphatase superfamily)